jgi:sulfur carrier protein ThiS adenylyltransferase
MEFNRQYNIYNPENTNLDVTIIGAGSTGSFTALNLAKMGISNIKVIDFDIVEDHNIPNQFFRIRDVGKPKVEALKEIIEDFTEVKIDAENVEIKEEYDFDITLNSMVIMCVDSIEARKLIYDKIKDFPIKLIDTRFGGEGYSIHVVDLNNDEDKLKFEKSLEGEIKETPCGMKGIIYTILSLASEVCNIVKKMDLSEEYPKILRREMKVYRFIGGGLW